MQALTPTFIWRVIFGSIVFRLTLKLAPGRSCMISNLIVQAHWLVPGYLTPHWLTSSTGFVIMTTGFRTCSSRLLASLSMSTTESGRTNFFTCASTTFPNILTSNPHQMSGYVMYNIQFPKQEQNTKMDWGITDPRFA